MDVRLLPYIVTYSNILLLITIAYKLTSSTIHAPNYSIGYIMTFGGYITTTLVRYLAVPPYWGLPTSLVIGMCFGYVSYLIIFRELIKRKRSPTMMFISTVGLGLIVSKLIQIYTLLIIEIYQTYPVFGLIKEHDFRIGNSQGVAYVSTLIALIVFILIRFSSKTKTGLAHKSKINNSELAEIQGVNISKLDMIIWTLSGGLTFLAGSMWPLMFQTGWYYGPTLMLSIFATSQLSKNNDLSWCFIGAFLVGSAEVGLTTIGQGIIGVWVGEYRFMIPLIILVITLTIKSIRNR